MALRTDEGEERTEVVGRSDHPSVREEEHKLEEGEFITKVTTHHPKADLQTGELFRYENKV